MRVIMTSVAALVLGFTAPVWAGEHDTLCANASSGTQVSAASLRANLQGLGYRVGRIKAEHGCYEVRADNASGYQIKAIYHPATGELMQAKLH